MWMRERELGRSGSVRNAALVMAIAAWLTPCSVGAAGHAQDDSERAEAAPKRPDRLRIEITGHEFQWHVRYPGPDGKLGTADDVAGRRHVRVPVGRHVELILQSRDYLYTLALPHERLKEIAVPDLTFSMRLTAKRVGTFELRGDQFCGYSHPELIGEFVVMTEPDFERWTRQRVSSSDGVQ